MMTLIATVLASATEPTDVVVYPDRAQVTRATPVTCGQRAALVFEGVPPSAQQDSFRATVNVGTVDGLRAELVQHEKQFSAKAEALEKQLETLEDERRVLDASLAKVEAGRALAKHLREVAEAGLSRELAAEKPDVKAWSSALDTPLQTSLAAAKQTAELTRTKTVLERSIDDVRRQLDDVRAGAQRASYRVEVLVTCPAGQTAQLALSYLVGGAAWVPAYEARANETSRAVALSTYATVTQRTGEPWTNVKLVLSTAVPSQNATPPTMNKLLVGATERAPERKVLVARQEYVASAAVAQSGPSTPPAQPSGLVAKSQGVSVQLEVRTPSTVSGDGAPVRLFVGDTSLEATFELRVTPRLQPVAFRVATLTNTGEWPLLEGRVDAFRSTGLVGRYPLERVAQGAPFSLTFGVEESVRVKHTIVEEAKRDASLFNSKHRFTYAYRFELANYSKATSEVTVVDQVPVAEVNDLDIALTEKTTAGAQVNKATGVVTWKLPLKPAEKRNVDFGFRVDVPSSYGLGQ